MSFVNEISVRDANNHNYVHPSQFIGKINNCLYPWRMVDIGFENSNTGKMIMNCRLIDMSKMGATRVNEMTNEEEYAYGIEVSFPLMGLLPTKDELEIFLETIRQDLGIAGKCKIYMGR